MDFEQHILVHIYYDGIILLDESEKYFQIKLNLNEFHQYMDETCDVLKYKIEQEMRTDLIRKLKSKIQNVVSISRSFKIPVKHVLHTLFMNNRANNIEIMWSPSALKEFKYVPMKHYITYRDDSLTLNVKGIKFSNKV